MDAVLTQDEREDLARSVPDLLLAEKLGQIFKKLNKGRYHVTHGAVNWSKHDFNLHPDAVCFLFSDRGFLAEFNPITVTIEIFTRMPQTATNAPEGIDATLSALMVRDAQQAIGELRKATRKNGDGIVMLVVPESDLIVEVSDNSLGIQGIIASVGFVI